MGIIHKDLKPSNVFMRQDAEGRWHPMLADFGIGAVADRSQLERRGITVAGFTHSLLEPGSSRTGTRMYQPPEASLGPAGHASRATSTRWACCSTRWSSATSTSRWASAGNAGWKRPARAGWRARRPEEGGTGRAELASRRRSDLARRQAAVALDPSGELNLRLLRDDIGDCVTVDPAARLPSVAQLVDRLQTGRNGSPRRPSPPPQPSEPRLRHATPAASPWAIHRHGADHCRRPGRIRVRPMAPRAGSGSLPTTPTASTENEQRAIKNEQKAQASAKAARQQSQFALDTLNAMIFDVQRGLKNLSGTARSDADC